jgi:hypothetical protein
LALIGPSSRRLGEASRKIKTADINVTAEAHLPGLDNQRMSHPAQTNLRFLPKRLVHFCNMVVEQHHATHGYSSLAAHMWHKDTNVFIAPHEDLFALLGAATAAWKIRNFSFVVGIGLLILSSLINWALIWGLVPLFFIVRHFTKRMHSFYVLAAALILAVEIAGNNFRELVTDLPEVFTAANERLQKYLSSSTTRFLDFYLPLRDDAPDSVYTQLASLLKTELDITPSLFQEIYLRTPGANHRPEAEEVVELLVNAGIGVGKYGGCPLPEIFWQKASAAANQLYIWLEQNPAATREQRLAHARKVVDINRLVHRSLRTG